MQIEKGRPCPWLIWYIQDDTASREDEIQSCKTNNMQYYVRKRANINRLDNTTKSKWIKLTKLDRNSRDTDGPGHAHGPPWKRGILHHSEP